MPNPQDWQVRAAQTKDAKAIHDCVHAAYQHYLPRIGKAPAPMRADYAQLVRADTGITQVYVLTSPAIEADPLPGVLVLKPARNHLLLDNLAVHPEWQGQGLGQHLLRFTEHTALKLGTPCVRLYTNEAMHENLAWYPKQGYRITKRCKEAGYRRVYFEKVLG